MPPGRDGSSTRLHYSGDTVSGAVGTRLEVWERAWPDGRVVRDAVTCPVWDAATGLLLDGARSGVAA